MLLRRIEQNQCTLILIGRVAAWVFLILFAVGWVLIENKWIKSSLSLEPILFIIDVPLIIGLEVLQRQRCGDAAKQKFDTIDLSNPRNQRIRTALLQNARSQWMDDYLENTLQNIVRRLNLIKSSAPTELARNAKIGAPLREEREIPKEKPIVDLFHESGNALLILGEPGTGKTFSLAELARDLIAEAEQDEMVTIPLILSLDSWRRELDFMDWLAEQLNLQYQLSRKLAPNWIVSGHIALLLDGLDEVGETERNGCVAAINAFCEAYKIDVAVCCRAEEYRLLPTKLNLSQAIRLLPLTNDQIVQFLQEIGPNATDLLEAIQKDSSMMELAQAPLFLNIMALAYRDLPTKELAPLQNVPARRRHLYDAYIRQQFKKIKEENTKFGSKQGFTWLVWIAKRMKQLEKTEFFLERLQVHWLPGSKSRLYQAIKTGALLGLAFGIPYGASVGLAFSLAYGFLGGLTWGIIAGLLGGVTVGLRFGQESFHSEVNIADEIKFVRPSSKEVFSTLIFGSLVWLVFYFGAFTETPLILGLASALIMGYFYGSVVGLANGIASGLASGIVGGVAVGLIIQKTESELIGGIIGGLTGGIVFASMGGLSIGLKSNDIGIQTETGIGVHRSRKTSKTSFIINGIASFLIIATPIGIIGWLAQGPLFGVFGALFFWMTAGLALSTLAAIKDGGNAILNLYLLRHTLTKHNYMPGELEKFLAIMARINLLQRKGSGYRFIHLTLRDHVAQLDPQTFRLD